MQQQATVSHKKATWVKIMPKRNVRCAFLVALGRSTSKATLDHFMSFAMNEAYACDYVYSDEELLQITPQMLLEWMNFRTFGTIMPAVDANPISARSSSLGYWKKAISFFHPNQLIAWSEGQKEGNPTQSVEINNPIAESPNKEIVT